VEKAYAAWRAFQDRFLAHAAALLLLGCTLLALLEVVRRYVFGFSYEWQQDAVTFFTVSGVFLYFSIAQRRDAHLSVTVIPELLAVLGPRGARAADIIRLVALVFSFLFLLAVVWWGIPEVEDSVKYETRTESLGFPMWPFLLALLVGFAFMAVTMFFQIYRGIQKLRGVSVLEEPADKEEALHKAVD
jgi:TRAP-type C4-dicarboxylate transport system permease small subunit